MLENAFVFESTPSNNKVFIGKHELGQGNDVAEVRIRQQVLLCHPIISENVAKIKTWMILPHLTGPGMYGAYFFDSDSQFFINSKDKNKQPFVFRGLSSAVEASDPPLVDNYYRISKGKFLTRGETTILSGQTLAALTITHIVKVRFRSLPKKQLGTDTSELFYTFISDKKMEIYVTYDRRFHFKVGSQTKTTKSFNMINFRWYHVRITYTRGVYPAYFFDCSVEIEVVGLGRDGHELLCKLMFDFYPKHLL